MNTLEIIRLDFGLDGTFSVLRYNKVLLSNMYALELPWRDNKVNVSCIPTGNYRATIEHHAKLKEKIIRLHDVPGRTGILFHAANVISELKGCIAVGNRIAKFTYNRGVTNSKNTLSKLLEIVDEPLTVSIIR